METPIISVVLPVYNAAQFLEATLKSLLGQTLTNFEIIAINDGSNDASEEILRSAAALDSRIRVFSQANMGLVPTLNKALDCARCEIIARADADDLYAPNRLELQVARMAEAQNVVLLGARTIKIDQNGRILYREYQPETHSEILPKLLGGFGGVVPHPTVCFRKSVVQSVGCYRAEAKHGEDLDLWLRLSAVGELQNLKEHLLFYRVHANSVCAVHWREQRQTIKKIATSWQSVYHTTNITDTFWDRPEPTQAGFTKAWADKASSQGYHATALHYALERIRTAPGSMNSWATLSRCVFRGLRDVATGRLTAESRTSVPA